MAGSFKVALALGGGGVRGLAHLGVFKALEEANIPINLIVGTSMGGIIGGIYALAGKTSRIEPRLLGLLKRDEIIKLEAFAGESRPAEKRMLVEKLAHFVKDLVIWNLKGLKRALVNGGPIKNLIQELIKDSGFSQTKIPFACIACDLKTGDEVILNKGRMLEAIMASSAMPGVFEPVYLQGRFLIDGGITSEIPIEAARKLGADFVIAINVEQNIFHSNFRHGMDILFQSDEIRCHELIRMKLQLADFVIRPRVENYSWAAFSKSQDCIQEGERAARQMENALKTAIAKRKRVRLLKKCFFIK